MKTVTTLLITALAINGASAVEETATGYGRTATEALQNAKVLATEQAASTFVTGKKEAVNGEYKETIGQYSGGFIKSYKIKSTTMTADGYEVVIVADVNTDKINSVITSGGSVSVDVSSDLEKAQDEYNKTSAAFDEISKASPMFAAKIDNVKYENRGNRVMVIYSAHLEWTPKWVDDMATLGKTINRPIAASNPTSTLLNAVGTLSSIATPGLYSTFYSAAKHSENKPAEEEAMCFATKGRSSVKLNSCYGVYTLPSIEAMPKQIIVRATVIHRDGHNASKCFTVGNSNNNGMYEFYAAGSTVMFDFEQRKFPTNTLVIFKNSTYQFTFTANSTVEQLKQVSEVVVDVVQSKGVCD